MIERGVKWALRKMLGVPTVYRYVEQQVNSRCENGATLAFAPPGHFYSPLPNLGEVERDVARLYETSPEDDGINLGLEKQQRLLHELGAYYSGFDWPEKQLPGTRFYLKNDYFEHGDAVALYSMIRHFQPRRIIEVGSGFSSAVMLDTNDRYCAPKMELCFIEPYPQRLEKLLKPQDRSSTKIITAPVQSVPLEEFDRLEANDILFIDSSHVSKIGSDVNHLLFSVLPRLRPGVLVHFHDIFYPFEYPIKWVREGRAWNEIYLLRAFLQYNSAFEVQLFNAYLWHVSPELVEKHLPIARHCPGGSIWLRKIGETSTW